MELKIGQIYRQFKGNLYRLITVAEHSETGEALVIYQALYGDNRVYARPLAMFTERVDRAKYPDADQEYRFTLWDGIAVKGAETAGADASVQIAERDDAGAGQGGRSTSEQASVSPIKFSDDLPEGVSANVSDPAVSEEAAAEALNAFLDAREFEEKLQHLLSMKSFVTDGMIDTMAYSLDLELNEGTTAERYQELVSCVRLREKYENSRLRG